MTGGPLNTAYGRLQRRYPLAILVLQFQLAHVVTAGGVLLLWLYQDMERTSFWRIMACAQLLILLDNLIATRIALRCLRPVRPWLAGERSPATASRAWRALAALPAQFVRRHRVLPPLEIVAVVAFASWELELDAGEFLLLLLGGLVVLLYGVCLRVLAMEIALRPILRDVSRDLPADAELGPGGIPLRVKLLAGLPLVNVVTGVVVAGLTGRGGQDLTDFAGELTAAVAVASTVSLWLTVLLARSILRPVADLREATDRVRGGDLRVHVPVTATDETGAMAQSFNEMVAGLAERERLHEAFGAFVDPGLARRIVEGGHELEGEELDVSVLFLDIRDFTAWAERATVRQVLERLNAFFDLVVPVVQYHGGRADKFVGDGLLAVFGAPEPRPDHADRAVSCALDTVEAVRRRYGDSLRIGIGVNSGRVMAGTVGGGGRVEFSVIGDVVNTAQRVEEATRATGDDLLVTDATRWRLSEVEREWEARPSVPLKGKRAKVALWAPAPPTRRERAAQAVRTVLE